MARTSVNLTDILLAIQKREDRPRYRADEVLAEHFELADAIPIAVQVILYAKNTGTGAVVATIIGTNTTPSVGKHAICDALIDTAAQYDTGITYCAIGTDDTTPTLADTTLGTEHHRNTITSKSRTGNVIVLSTDFTAAEATAAIEEVGLFGTSTATGSADSGVLFGRALLSYDNSAGNYDITVDYEITIG